MSCPQGAYFLMEEYSDKQMSESDTQCGSDERKEEN